MIQNQVDQISVLHRILREIVSTSRYILPAKDSVTEKVSFQSGLNGLFFLVTTPPGDEDKSLSVLSFTSS